MAFPDANTTSLMQNLVYPLNPPLTTPKSCSHGLGKGRGGSSDWSTQPFVLTESPDWSTQKLARSTSAYKSRPPIVLVSCSM